MAALPFKHIIKLADYATINYLMRNKAVDLAIRCYNGNFGVFVSKTNGLTIEILLQFSLSVYFCQTGMCLFIAVIASYCHSKSQNMKIIHHNIHWLNKSCYD